uniref:Thioredoxin domain-containing protein n=1 Tax=Pavo cristatus TaxID=9049 RepID=A0A8C9LE92_PAVCR
AERRLLGSPSAWAVEFFASWCGHCIHFAPTWRALAEDVREWRPAVMLAALDCADEANQQVCADFGITGFPTLKVRFMGRAMGMFVGVGNRERLSTLFSPCFSPWRCPSLAQLG